MKKIFFLLIHFFIFCQINIKFTLLKFLQNFFFKLTNTNKQITSNINEFILRKRKISKKHSLKSFTLKQIQFLTLKFSEILSETVVKNNFTYIKKYKGLNCVNFPICKNKKIHLIS
jgi:hypothetical protein